MKRLTFMDCFAGIGGFRMALEQLGFVCVASCEIDKHARKAYKAIYGWEEPFYGDIKDVDPRELPDFDLLTGGFPCQAFSVAGKRRGFEDTRGTLFFEIVRIAKEKRPKAILLENVKGLVNHDKGRTLDIMIETLNEIGYIVDFDILNSKYFGVPQNRERIFIVAMRDDLIEQEEWSEETTKGNTIVRKRKRQINEWAKTFNFDWPEQDEVTTRLRDILEPEVDEKYYLSEEKTAKLIAQLNGNHEGETDKFLIDDQGRTTKELKPLDISPTLRREMHGNEPRVVEHQVPEWIPKPDEISRTLRSGGKASLSDKHNYDHVAVKAEGFSNQDMTGIDIVGHLSKFQNDRIFSDKGLSPTVSASGGNSGGHGGGCLLTPLYRIRRLTPLECWRLQGFPDWAFDRAKSAGISDTQLYKQAGNAVTVNVIYEIGKRLVRYVFRRNTHKSQNVKEAKV